MTEVEESAIDFVKFIGIWQFWSSSC